MTIISKMMKANIVASTLPVLFILCGCSTESGKETSADILKTPEAKVSEVTVSGFRIDWGKVYGAESYSYALDGAETKSTTDLSVSFSDLEAATEYVVKLQADPAENNSKESSEPVYIHVRTSEVTQLDKPEITVGSTYASKTIISWSVIPGAGSYEYNIGDISGATSENRLTLPNLAKETDYTFSVRAIPSGNGHTASEASTVNFKTSSEDVPALLIVPETVLADAVVFDIYATPDETYYYDVVSSSSRMLYDDTTIMEKYRAAIIEYAKSKGISIRLAMASVLKIGTNSFSISSLTSEMSYDIIAFGMDYDGNITTGLQTKRITTTATGWSSGPNYGGTDWFSQRFYLSNEYAALSGYGWTNSVWMTWKGNDVQSIRYRLLPTSTFNKAFSNPYDEEAIKTFLRDPSYSYAVKDEYLTLVNSANGYNSLTPCSAGTSYTISTLATSTSGEEELTVNSITTKTSSEERTWFTIAALTNEKYGPTSTTIACVLRGVAVTSGKMVLVKTSSLSGIPVSSYPALVADKGVDMKETYFEPINGNGLALLMTVEPATSYTVLATVVNRAGDKLTKYASVTTTAASEETSATSSVKPKSSDELANTVANAVATPVGLRLDGMEAIPAPGNKAGEEDIWTIIHNMHILGTANEK